MQYLYLLKSDSYFKIGIAYDVQARIAQLSTGNPHEIELILCFGFDNADIVERAIHQKFAASRKRGEWFGLTGENIAEFEKLCNMLGGELIRINNVVSEAEIEDAENEFSENSRIEIHCHNKDGRHVHSVFVVDPLRKDRSRGRKSCGSIEYPRPEFSQWSEEIEQYMQSHSCFTAVYEVKK